MPCISKMAINIPIQITKRIQMNPEADERLSAQLCKSFFCLSSANFLLILLFNFLSFPFFPWLTLHFFTILMYLIYSLCFHLLLLFFCPFLYSHHSLSCCESLQISWRKSSCSTTMPYWIHPESNKELID